ncbi:MAG: DUF2282 domain-containing protein [Chitinophagales bacterium]
MITKSTGKKMFLTAAAITLLGGLTSMTVTPEETSNRGEVEKCYCIAKAGMNDCAAGPGTSCAGASPNDGSCDHWVYVRKGQCHSLVNGKTQKDIDEGK